MMGRLAASLRLRPESDRFLHLDAMRFVASAGVVAFHYRKWMTWRAPPVPLDALFGFGQFVDLFFVISGIVICDLYRGRIGGRSDYRRFLRRRIARLVPLHLLTLAFFCLVALLAERFGHAGSRADWACLVPTALLVHAFGTCDRLAFNTPSWSISAEMAMYVAFPLVATLLRRERLAWAAWAAILVALAALDLGGGPPWYARTFDLGVVRAVPAFLFGGLLAGRRDLLGRIPGASALMWATLALFVALRIAEAPAASRVACVYLVPLFALAADQRRGAGRAVRAIAPLGQLTYSIYMLHLPVAWVVLDFAAPRLGVGGRAMDLAVVATALVVLPAVSIASLRLFETPMRRWLSADRPRRGASFPLAPAAGDFAP